MSGVDRINQGHLFNGVRLDTDKNNQNNSHPTEQRKADKISSSKANLLNKITYEKLETNYSSPAQESVTAIKRPLKIDESNNIFYINYKGKNKTVKIEPGEYNLIELRNAIQDRVSEKFGIGKVKVDLTGSGSDRLLKAQDSKIYNSKRV